MAANTQTRSGEKQTQKNLSQIEAGDKLTLEYESVYGEINNTTRLSGDVTRVDYDTLGNLHEIVLDTEDGERRISHDDAHVYEVQTVTKYGNPRKIGVFLKGTDGVFVEDDEDDEDDEQDDFVSALKDHDAVESAGEGGKDGDVALWLDDVSEQAVDDVAEFARNYGYENVRVTWTKTGRMMFFDPNEDDEQELEELLDEWEECDLDDLLADLEDDEQVEQ